MSVGVMKANWQDLYMGRDFVELMDDAFRHSEYTVLWISHEDLKKFVKGLSKKQKKEFEHEMRLWNEAHPEVGSLRSAAD